jgi:hypothetical protein
MKMFYSKFAIKELMKNGELKNCAVISFYTPQKTIPDEVLRVDYSGACDRVFYIAVPDIDEEHLSEYGYTYDSYIANAHGLAEFIYNAKADKLNIICQCEFGSKRSVACAAAVLEHFESRGNDIFSSLDYSPNMLVYEKVLGALEAYKIELQNV